MKKFLHVLLVAALVFCMAPAMATGFGAGLSGWKAKVDAGSSSVSTGGSMSETQAWGNGLTANATVNSTGGYASAGGDFSPHGASTYSEQSSYSNGLSGSVTFGNAVGNTAGGQGTDVNAGAWSTFKSGGFGGSIGWGW